MYLSRGDSLSSTTKTENDGREMVAKLGRSRNARVRVKFFVQVQSSACVNNKSRCIPRRESIDCNFTAMILIAGTYLTAESERINSFINTQMVSYLNLADNFTGICISHIPRCTLGRWMFTSFNYEVVFVKFTALECSTLVVTHF